jgi:hypothetical protein
MRIVKTISLTFFILGLIVTAVNAQANSLKKISFVFDRYSSPMTTDVSLISDNINVKAKFRTDTAPRACSPCTQLYFISLGPSLDDAGIIGASGTIDGIYYPNLYVRLNDFRYFSTGYGRVPKLWTKTVRVAKIPVDMRGNLGIWRTPEEVGNNSIALYLHNNMEFTGTANLHLSWYLRPNEPRLYWDRYLSLDFAYAGN